MKIVIIGGYGVFGSLTARLLARDGHQLWLAGRNPEKARELAKELGAETLKVDIHGAPEALFGPSPDVVIDAAGPYQHYGADPYLIPRLCVEYGCNYLDLSDSSEFTRGVSVLDEAAKDSGVFVLSGASSVPGLSSIVIDDLVDGLEDIELVDTAILPGNRAPRGMSVIKSIVSGVGRPSKVLRDGKWETLRGWSDRKIYELAPGLRRAAYFVDVPDIQLLPERIKARSVMFRAGLELPVMNWSLSALGWLRRYWRLELPELAYSVLQMLSKAVFAFGTDRGGMQVSIVGRCGNERVCRKWVLVAEEGDGPYVPGMACRAVLREIETIAPGARPCLGEVPLGVIEDALSDLAITTEASEEVLENPDWQQA